MCVYIYTDTHTHTHTHKGISTTLEKALEKNIKKKKKSSNGVIGKHKLNEIQALYMNRKRETNFIKVKDHHIVQLFLNMTARAWGIFPFLCIIFNVLHQCFTVFGVQVFHLSD